MPETKPRILGRLLVEEGAISEEELKQTLGIQAGTGRRLGEILIENGRIDQETLARGLAAQLGLPYRPGPLESKDGARALIPPDLARRRAVLPLDSSARSVTLAMADPLDVSTLDDVRFRCGRRVDAVVVTEADLREGLARAYGGELEALLDALPDVGDAGDEDSLEREARAAPVVRLVDHILARAVEAGASDIHLERKGSDVRVRYRIDGLLREAGALPGRARSAVLSRLKVMAGMDIAVKRRPQDGGLVLRRSRRELSLRVSTLPVTGGEKAVVRVLDPQGAPERLEALGLAGQALARLRAVLRAGHGVLLATGPTGSGKSSTLHAALLELDRSTQNVVTLEDPVEYRIPGVTQVQVAPRAGLTFPAALRSVLRQDPGVVMVGEIRDRETAEIAMAAAVTGHLVLSTLHTVDAPGAVTRLLDMGVPPYLVGGGLAGVVAQRLVRKSCPACRARSEEGCSRCRGGYRGRTGVFQVMLVTDEMRAEIMRSSGPSAANLQRVARESGMTTMADDARRKVAEGVTTPHEIGRVLRGDPAASLPCPGCGTGVPSGAEGCPTCGRRLQLRCSCGRLLANRWRFCPWCLGKVVQEDAPDGG
jgi:type IV pilus assembly protein PilB